MDTGTWSQIHRHIISRIKNVQFGGQRNIPALLPTGPSALFPDWRRWNGFSLNKTARYWCINTLLGSNLFDGGADVCACSHSAPGGAMGLD